MLLSELFTFADDYTQKRSGERTCDIIKFPQDKSVTITQTTARTPIVNVSKNGKTIDLNFRYDKWELYLAKFLEIDPALYAPKKILLESMDVLVDVYGDVIQDSIEEICEQARKRARKNQLHPVCSCGTCIDVGQHHCNCCPCADCEPAKRRSDQGRSHQGRSDQRPEE